MRSSFSLSTLVPALGLTLLLAGCEPPPVETTQIGYRGLGTATVQNPDRIAELRAANQVPAALPAVPSDGPLARDVYQNVQVLGDLSVAEFTRVMLAITAWVAPPDQSCAYCHQGADLANDDTYTKVVSRRMLQMTRDINANWKNHVAETGVTCWTCHRGNAVPQNVWFTDPGPDRPSMMAGNRAGQNAPAPSVGIASLPVDPFTPYLLGDNPIRVVPTTALPSGSIDSSTQQTENTYGLMMHMTGALGVNCTFCHNSRSFQEWAGSSPQRVTAFHGIELVRNLNVNYLEGLTANFPPHRLGPTGDVAKVNCSTCHQGVSKPMFGVSQLPDYPSLAGPAAVAPPAPAAEPGPPATPAQ